MAGGHKRTFAEFLESSEPTLTLLTPDGGRIPAHSEVRPFPNKPDCLYQQQDIEWHCAAGHTVLLLS